MYVHRQRGKLSEVRKVETQPTVGGKGRRSLAPGPRSAADGGHGPAGRDVQSVRHGPGRPDGPRDVLVTPSRRSKHFPEKRCSLMLSSSDAVCNGLSLPTCAASPARLI